MITPSIRTTVSVVTIGATLTIGACMRTASSITPEGQPATTEHRLVIRFDNVAPAYVDVYLITEQRQWRLGRVEPGANTTLRVPQDALNTKGGFVRLAVLENAPLSMQAALEPRAVVSIAQPISTLLKQRWTFSQNQAASAQIMSAPLDVFPL